jgi:rubrerythrin
VVLNRFGREKKPIGPVEALKMALQVEKDGIQLYQQLSLEAKSAADVFNFLIDEEMKHEKLIEEKIRELTKD